MVGLALAFLPLIGILLEATFFLALLAYTHPEEKLLEFQFGADDDDTDCWNPGSAEARV